MIKIKEKRKLKIKKSNLKEPVFLVEELKIPEDCDAVTITIDLPVKAVQVLVLYDSNHQPRVTHQSPVVPKEFNVSLSDKEIKFKKFLPAGNWTLAMSIDTSKLKKSKNYYCSYSCQICEEERA